MSSTERNWALLTERSRAAALRVDPAVARALVGRGVGLQLLEGPLKGSGREFAMTFVGARKHVAECRDFFASTPRFGPAGVTHPDLLLIAEPLPLPQDDALRYPFLDAQLDVRETVEVQIQAVRSKAHRRRLRQVFRSKDWKWSVGERPEDLEDFYTAVHRPYVQARFGERARIDPLGPLLKRFEKGGRVLIVREDGEAVCGAVLFDRAGGLDYDRNGFRLDALKTPLVLAQRTAALELAVFQLAQELKAGTIDQLHQPHQAIVAITNALQKLPEHPVLLLMRADALTNAGKFALAKEDCDALLARSPNFSMALEMRARIHLEEENALAALADADQAIANGHDSSQIYVYRGVSKMLLQEFVQAEEDLEVACEKNPDYVIAKFHLAQRLHSVKTMVPSLRLIRL